MRRVLVLTWALGTASGVLLGLFGVQLVSSRFSTSRVSPMSHPEVLRALQAARAVPAEVEQIALPVGPDPDTAPPASPPTDDASARPSAEAASVPASTLPRPGAGAGPLVDAAAAPSTTSTVTAPPEPSSSSTTSTTAKPPDSSDRAKTNSKKDRPSTTTTTATTRKNPSSNSGSQTQTKTISTNGGIVSVRWTNGKVELRSARPDSGWDMTVFSNGPDNVVVRFTKGRRTSWVWAGYKNNSPASTTAECTGPSMTECRQH